MGTRPRTPFYYPRMKVRAAGRQHGFIGRVNKIIRAIREASREIDRLAESAREAQAGFDDFAATSERLGRFTDTEENPTHG